MFRIILVIVIITRMFHHKPFISFNITILTKPTVCCLKSIYIIDNVRVVLIVIISK